MQHDILKEKVFNTVVESAVVILHINIFLYI